MEEMAEIKRKLERSQGMIVPSVRRSGGFGPFMEGFVVSGGANILS